jgi:hypothetical protein
MGRLKPIVPLYCHCSSCSIRRVRPAPRQHHMLRLVVGYGKRGIAVLEERYAQDILMKGHHCLESVTHPAATMRVSRLTCTMNQSSDGIVYMPSHHREQNSPGNIMHSTTALKRKPSGKYTYHHCLKREPHPANTFTNSHSLTPQYQTSNTTSPNPLHSCESNPTPALLCTHSLHHCPESAMHPVGHSIYHHCLEQAIHPVMLCRVSGHSRVNPLCRTKPLDPLLWAATQGPRVRALFTRGMGLSGSAWTCM